MRKRTSNYEKQHPLEVPRALTEVRRDFAQAHLGKLQEISYSCQARESIMCLCELWVLLLDLLRMQAKKWQLLKAIGNPVFFPLHIQANQWPIACGPGF